MEFLVISNYVMLHGMSDTASGFTLIFVKGVAVVDYVIVNQDWLHSMYWHRYY